MALKRGTTAATHAQPQQEVPAEVLVQQKVEGSLQDDSVPFDGGAVQQSPATAAPPAAEPSKAVSVPSGGALAGVGDAGDGFNALDNKIGFGSFTIIKLDKDKFIAGKDEVDEFICRMISARSKFVYKADDEHLVYSYDGETAVDDKPLVDHFTKWASEGITTRPVKSEYMEIVVEIRDPNLDMDGQMALLSVPPASVKRLSGYRATLRYLHKASPMDVLTTCFKGPKVTPKSNKKTFYPWDFKPVLDENKKVIRVE